MFCKSGYCQFYFCKPDLRWSSPQHNTGALTLRLFGHRLPVCQRGLSLEALTAPGYSAPQRVTPSSCEGDSQAAFLQQASASHKQVQETHPKIEISIHGVKTLGKKTVRLRASHLAEKLALETSTSPYVLYFA